MEEVWKPITGYESLYEVSSLGRVKGLPRYHKTRFTGFMKKERILKPRLDSYGYQMVMLCKDKVQRNFLVHRLVAIEFIENPLNYECINHKDENKLNNNVDNLEWCDRLYNNNYGTRNKRMSETLKKKYADKRGAK